MATIRSHLTSDEILINMVELAMDLVNRPEFMSGESNRLVCEANGLKMCFMIGKVDEDFDEYEDEDDYDI